MVIVCNFVCFKVNCIEIVLFIKLYKLLICDVNNVMFYYVLIRFLVLCVLVVNKVYLMNVLIKIIYFEIFLLFLFFKGIVFCLSDEEILD